MSCKKVKALIIGSGNIGTDILIKLRRSNLIDCKFFVGKNSQSEGLLLGKTLGVQISSAGSRSLIEYMNEYDLVFDATSAYSHNEHAVILKKLNKYVIDLTPSKLGKMCIPVINSHSLFDEKNISMVTCGGQASVPLAYALNKVHSHIEYIEVISSIASDSAGLATRENIDEYIETTESAIKFFSGCSSAKAILNINPAKPCVEMKTTLYAKIQHPDIYEIKSSVKKIVKKIQRYVPGYELVVDPVYDGSKVIIMVKVRGQGDYLPTYAGNLDIITSTSVFAAEKIAQKILDNSFKSTASGIDYA